MLLSALVTLVWSQMLPQGQRVFHQLGVIILVSYHIIAKAFLTFSGHCIGCLLLLSKRFRTSCHPHRVLWSQRFRCWYHSIDLGELNIECTNVADSDF